MGLTKTFLCFMCPLFCVSLKNDFTGFRIITVYLSVISCTRLIIFIGSGKCCYLYSFWVKDNPVNLYIIRTNSSVDIKSEWKKS